MPYGHELKPGMILDVCKEPYVFTGEVLRSPKTGECVPFEKYRMYNFVFEGLYNIPKKFLVFYAMTLVNRINGLGKKLTQRPTEGLLFSIGSYGNAIYCGPGKQSDVVAWLYSFDSDFMGSCSSDRTYTVNVSEMTLLKDVQFLEKENLCDYCRGLVLLYNQIS